MVIPFKKFVNNLPLSLQKRLPKNTEVIKISQPESQRLNHVYRNKNKPTNVLSFRYDNDYGEILVCPEIIRQEAKKQGHSFKYQMTWMILHGMIHLAGVHHESSSISSRKFTKLEQAVLKKLFRPLKFEIRISKFETNLKF